jgi:hypothetical protein
MKRYLVTFILAAILVFMVVNYFSVPVLASDSASCKSGNCSCSCSGVDCECSASGGTCTCECEGLSKSSCGIDGSQQ